MKSGYFYNCLSETKLLCAQSLYHDGGSINTNFHQNVFPTIAGPEICILEMMF